jgi:hypothetical protein
MEPKNDAPPKQLAANTERQAADSLRGYGYQIWQSVHAWLELGEDEVLALEGAEDFDVIGGEVTVATQVKDLARNITLRSKDVVEAIANFWELKDKNSECRLRFRFLTTAWAGVEQGRPFGKGVAGIEIWRQAGKGGPGLDQLRTFLLKEEKLPERILTFLRTALDEEIRAELLEPFEWFLALGPTDYIEAAVKRKLIVHGEKHGVPAHDAEKVAAALFTAAFSAASRKTWRFLYRSDFLKTFDETTSKRISPAEARAVAAAYGSSVFFPSESFPIVPLSAYSPVSSPPPLPAQLAPREKLVTDLSSILAKAGSLALGGSTGMGKSTLAKLLVFGSSWLWASLRSGQNTNPQSVLMLLAEQLDSGSDRNLQGVVFDDYSADSVDDNLFHGLLYTLRTKDLPFIVTTSKALPTRISTSLDLDSSFFQVPGLNREEIGAWLVACSCPADLITPLSSFLLALTSGHPQLIHARLRHLVRIGWKAPDLDDLVQTPRGVDEVRVEARQLLQSLPEEARTLAYRLSMAAQPFRRDHVLVIGQSPPQISAAGDFLDLLIGPWVERLTDSYFRISPLLGGSARDVWPADQLKLLHRSWSYVLWNSTPRTQTEAIGSFFHAFVGENVKGMCQVSFGLLGSEEVVQKGTFASLQWFVNVGVDAPMPPFIPAAEERLVLRVLQYRMAAEPDQRRKVAAVWDEESQRYPSEERRPVYRFMFLLTVALDYKARHEIPRLFLWLRESFDLLKRLQLSQPDLVGLLEEGRVRTNAIDFQTGLFLVIVVQCSNIDDLSSLLGNLESLEENLRLRVLRLFSLSFGTATSLIDRCWLAEREKSQPDWEHCIGVLDRAKALGESWDCVMLREAATRAKIIIFHEILAGADEALGLLAKEIPAIRESVLLVDQQAKLLQDRGEHREALTIWQEAIPRWIENGELDEVALVYAHRKAAVSAGYLNEWREAAHLFEEACSRLESYFARHRDAPEENKALKLAPLEFSADCSFCLWRASDQEAALEKFEAVILKLSELHGELGETDRYKIVSKILATMLLWLHNRSEAVEPFPGAASSGQSGEGILEGPPTKADNLWALLCRLEHKAGTSRILERSRQIISNSDSSLAKRIFAVVDVGQRLRHGDLNGLISAIYTFHDALLEGRETVPSDRERVEYLLGFLRFGLVSFEHHQREPDPPWAEWRSFVEENFPNETTLADTWFDLADEAFLLNPGSLMLIVRLWGGDPRFPFGALRAAASKALSPEAIFVAQIYLLLQSRGLEPVVGYLTSDVVESQWRRLVRSPALLVNPRMNVPNIEAACEIEEPGLGKAAAILLAALPAVYVHLGESDRAALVDIRERSRAPFRGNT